jgi:uncharacterized protein YjiS (DUF1127 family)
MERPSRNREADRGEAGARAAAPVRRAAVRALRRQLQRAAAAWREYRRRHRLEQELRGLDRRQLADIGLTRGDVPAVIDGSYFRDSSRRRHAPAASATAWTDRDPPRIARAVATTAPSAGI